MSHINPRCNTAYSGNIDLHNLFSASNIHWNIRLILLLPLGFLYSDAAMYLAHRYQQHRKVKFQEIVFEMHSVWHHGMFSNNKMHVDSIRDMNMVVLPFFVHGIVLKGLANHHKQHHNPKRMGKYNFGIATTIFDRVFGTRAL